MNRGTLVDVNVTCPAGRTASRTAGIRRYQDSALMSLRSRCRAGHRIHQHVLRGPGQVLAIRTKVRPENQQTPETLHVSPCRVIDPPGPEKPQVCQCPLAWALPYLSSVGPAEAVATSEPELSSRPCSSRGHLPHRIPWTTGLLDDRNWPTLTRPFRSSPIRGLQPIKLILFSHRRPQSGGPWRISGILGRWVPLRGISLRKVQFHLSVMSPKSISHSSTVPTSE